MLRIIEGGFSSVAYSEIKNEILRLTKEKKRVILLTPEQQSVIAEKEIIEILPENAPLTFEVTNFTRLANTVYRSLGGLAGEYIDKGKEALLMWKTLTELSGFLNLTSGGEINTGTVEKALSAVSEMKSLSLQPNELMEVAKGGKIKSGTRLSAKISDISSIMALYTKLTEEKYTSAKDECERLSVKLSENPEFFKDAHIYATGFTSFTVPQTKVLSELMKSAVLTVHLTLSKLTEDFFEFSEIKRTKSELLMAADRCGVKKELIRRDGKMVGTNPLIDGLTDILWRTHGEIDNQTLQETAGSVRIFEAQDPYEECDFVAADIKRRVMAGASFRDFAVIARCAEKYDGIISASFEGADIPYFISRRKDVSSYEAVKLIYAAHEAVLSDFGRDAVISYAKCGLSGISAEACDEFEIYTEVWQIDKKRFTDGIYWNMSPDGYDGRENAEKLRRINKTRDLLIDPLIKFGENLKSAETVTDYARVLDAFLAEIELEEKISKRIEELHALSEHAAAEENGRLWQAICDGLDSMVEVLPDYKINTRVFLNLLKIILGEVDLGKIPAFYDEVTVGSADMIRLTDKKHVYLIGVNQGEFPASPSNSSYFTDRDKQTLSSLGIMTDADNKIPLARELFFFSRAFSSGKESVTLSYSTRNEAFAVSEKADVIERIKSASADKLRPMEIAEIPDKNKVYYPKMALTAVSNAAVKDALTESGYTRDIEISDGKISNVGLGLSEPVRKMIYPDNLSLTQSRIDSFVDCPFLYYLRYNIKISEGERAEFNARNIGTFIHAILENFFAELRHSGESAGDIDEERRRTLVEVAARKYLNESVSSSELSKKRTSILLERLSRSAMPVVDGLCDELQGSKFTPEFFELKIDGEDKSLPSPASFLADDGSSVSIYGTIDRVDTFKKDGDVYVRVIDYKTGAKTFNPSDIDEGRNLQMFLYLKAITDTEKSEFREKLGVKESGEIIPAAVIYVKADMSDVTLVHSDKESEAEAIKKKQARRGMILNETESIEAMNKDYIPVKFKKGGEPDARSEKLLYTREGWAELNKKISEKVISVSKKMKSGDLALADGGKHSHCDSCKFKPICRKP